MGEMGEICGVLKVRVVKGRSLAVRDIRSSDPYVVLKLGNQVAKTKVINSNLNPVWDEELSLNISSTTPRCLKVVRKRNSLLVFKVLVGNSNAHL